MQTLTVDPELSLPPKYVSFCSSRLPYFAF